MKTPVVSPEDEVTLGSYVRYFAAMWWLGFRLMLKVAGGGIMAALMLAFASMLIHFVVFLVPVGVEVKNVVWWGLFLGFAAPIALYVGGSSVGFCPWLSSAQFVIRPLK